MSKNLSKNKTNHYYPEEKSRSLRKKIILTKLLKPQKKSKFKKKCSYKSHPRPEGQQLRTFM